MRAMVIVWPSNYEWVRWCLDMEELTWIKQINRKNISYYRDPIDNLTFSNCFLVWEMIIKMLSDLEELNWIDIKTIAELFRNISHINKNYNQRWGKDCIKGITDTVNSNSLIEQIRRLRGIDISEITYKYYSKTFPWELKDEEYREFWVRLNKWLHEQIDKLLEFVEKNP